MKRKEKRNVDIGNWENGKKLVNLHFFIFSKKSDLHKQLKTVTTFIGKTPFKSYLYCS